MAQPVQFTLEGGQVVHATIGEPAKPPSEWPKILWTALLATIGATVGSFVTAEFAKAQWERQTAAEQSRYVYEKRVALMDRLLVALNHADDARSYFARLKELCPDIPVNPNRQGSTVDSKCEASKRAQWIETRQKLNLLTADFNTSTSMASLVFGPETKAAYIQLQGTHSRTSVVRADRRGGKVAAVIARQRRARNAPRFRRVIGVAYS